MDVSSEAFTQGSSVTLNKFTAFICFAAWKQNRAATAAHLRLKSPGSQLSPLPNKADYPGKQTCRTLRSFVIIAPFNSLKCDQINSQDWAAVSQPMELQCLCLIHNFHIIIILLLYLKKEKKEMVNRAVHGMATRGSNAHSWKKCTTT